jgi:Xaa-Pro aminopeptidase
MQHNFRQELQAVAKQVLGAIGSTITSSDTEGSIAARAVEMLRALGVTETWYYQCPALVLLGSRSALSVSGRVYLAAEEPVGDVNLVTIDLSPSRRGIWADCARSFPIEDGRFVESPRDEELVAGLRTEKVLHNAMVSYVTSSTTFAELHASTSSILTNLGYENLDMGDNFGHSIASHLSDRTYIVAGNDLELGSVGYFTFEPHIRRCGGKWGIKHEDLYFFSETGRPCAL